MTLSPSTVSNHLRSEDQYIVRRTWTPTPSQFSIFKEREVTLCAQSLSALLPAQRLPASRFMLFSESTVQQAISRLEGEEIEPAGLPAVDGGVQ